MPTEKQTDQIRDQVRERYAAAASNVTSGAAASCCDSTGQIVEDGEWFGPGLYRDADRDELPEQAVAASLGCGNPLAVADLDPGEIVLDLGSGGGIDVLLSARRVGPNGHVYGLDMTDEMLDLARANAAKVGAGNVELIKGHIEQIPLPDSAVDVVISNCVINLSTDKPAVLAEMFRVLRPGGRIGVSDVVAENHLDAALRAERGSYVGCIAGALSEQEYRTGLVAVGFAAVSITFTHDTAPGMHGAIVRATKPIGSCCGVTACCSPAEQTIDPTQGLDEAKVAAGCGCVEN